MKTGLVLEGGAMRGLFTAGCLDILMENNITFPGAIGVSAGACFGCNFKSKQIGRVLKYNKERAKDPRYASIWSWLFTGDLFNVRFCYDTIPNKLYPFDNDTYRNNPMDFFVVVTDIESGKPVYVNCPSWDDEYYPWMRASASMPLASRVVKINGKGYLDGGIADPIPLKAFKEMGYEKNVVILTQPEDYVKGPNSLQSVMKVLLRKYPALVEDMRIRHELYNRETAFVKAEEKAGSAFVIRPEAPLDIGRTEHDKEKIQKCYDEGRRVMKKQLEALKSFLSN